jgi:cation:H+ antiporter
MAVWTLVPDRYTARGDGKTRFGIFGTTLLSFFVLEMGDKTQIATVALAAKFQALLPVVLGTTTGMLLADVPAVLLGEIAARKLPMPLVRAVAACAFIVIGLAVLFGAGAVRPCLTCALQIDTVPELIFELLAALGVILAAAEIFTNALEHLGERLRISEGVTGSLFAAVGTALPETIVPLLALIVGTSDRALNEEVGVGAILGAPLMLGTLTPCIMALAVLRQRGLRGRIRPEHSGFVRDLNVFLLAFALAAGAMFLPPSLRGGRVVLSVLLVGIYAAYIVATVRASASLVAAGHGTLAERALFLERLGLPVNALSIGAQLAGGLALLVWGAKHFIHGVEGVSHFLGVSALLLSLLLVPVATELPEKMNSVLWVRRGRDTLACGNITGAMVFQGTLLPALGILLTPWQPRREVLTGVVVALVAVLWLRLQARAEGLALWVLLVNGALYALFLAITLA